MTRTATYLALLLAGMPLLRPGTAQESPFVPIPDSQAALYRFKLGTLFFPSPAAERTARESLFTSLASLEKVKGTVAGSAANLYRALRLSDQIQGRFARHYIYLYLRYAINTKDSAAFEEYSRLTADLSRRTSFLQQELMRVDAKTFARFVAQQPALKPYAFAVRSARRLAPHTLSLKEEELLSALGPHTSDWQGELYQKVVDRTEWGKVRAFGSEFDVRRDRGTLNNSQDRAAREAGFNAVHHFFTSPMYYVNYVYANLLALKYYERYHALGPEKFVPRHVALMRNGFDAAPADLLKRFLQVDLRDPALVSGALQLLEARMKDLEALYASQA